MIKYLLAFFLTVVGIPASATTYYFSQCSGLHQAGCVAGDNANNGTSPSTPKSTATGISRSNNTFLYAEGGHFTDFKISNGTATNTTVSSYTPSWCTGGCVGTRPILTGRLTSGVTADTIEFLAVNSGTHTISNLDLRGNSDFNGTCVKIGRNTPRLTLDNIKCSGYSIGVVLTTTTTERHDGLVIKNSEFDLISGTGILGGARGGLVENNTFTRTAYDYSGKDPHPIYVSGFTGGMIVRGNSISQTGIDSVGAGQCTIVLLLAHGSHPDLVVENNTLDESATATTSGCFGIQLNGNTSTSTTPQDFTRVTIRGNKVIINGPGAEGISCGSCPDYLIENNIVSIYNTTGGVTGIAAPSYTTAFGGTSGTRPDAADTKGTIRNNSIYIDSNDTSAVGIRTNISATSGGTSGVVIASNAILWGTSSSASATCFVTNRAITDFTAHDYNTCYRAAGATVWSSNYATLALSITAGYSTNSSVSDPGLTTPASGNDFMIQASSGSAAVIDGASATYKARLSYRGKTANGSRDRGACEYRSADSCSLGTASVPSSPTRVR